MFINLSNRNRRFVCAFFFNFFFLLFWLPLGGLGFGLVNFFVHCFCLWYNIEVSGGMWSLLSKCLERTGNPLRNVWGHLAWLKTEKPGVAKNYFCMVFLLLLLLLLFSIASEFNRVVGAPQGERHVSMSSMEMYADQANGGRNPRKRSIRDRLGGGNVVQLAIGHQAKIRR